MKSRVQKKEMRWEKLDNTANLFPVIANETMTNVYRIAVILSENIRPECLQEALEQVLPWFNTMNVRMRTGMFWYYFETNTKGKPVVRKNRISLVVMWNVMRIEIIFFVLLIIKTELIWKYFMHLQMEWVQ